MRAGYIAQACVAVSSSQEDISQDAFITQAPGELKRLFHMFEAAGLVTHIGMQRGKPCERSCFNRLISASACRCDRLEAGLAVGVERQRLSPAERTSEALFTGLRMTDGIDRRAFLGRYGLDPWVQYGEALAPFVRAAFMWEQEGRFGLSRQGMLVANEILATFV